MDQLIEKKPLTHKLPQGGVLNQGGGADSEATAASGGKKSKGTKRMRRKIRKSKRRKRGRSRKRRTKRRKGGEVNFKTCVKGNCEGDKRGSFFEWWPGEEDCGTGNKNCPCPPGWNNDCQKSRGKGVPSYCDYTRDRYNWYRMNSDKKSKKLAEKWLDRAYQADCPWIKAQYEPCDEKWKPYKCNTPSNCLLAYGDSFKKKKEQLTKGTTHGPERDAAIWKTVEWFNHAGQRNQENWERIKNENPKCDKAISDKDIKCDMKPTICTYRKECEGKYGKEAYMNRLNINRKTALSETEAITKTNLYFQKKDEAMKKAWNGKCSQGTFYEGKSGKPAVNLGGGRRRKKTRRKKRTKKKARRKRRRSRKR